MKKKIIVRLRGIIPILPFVIFSLAGCSAYRSIAYREDEHPQEGNKTLNSQKHPVDGKLVAAEKDAKKKTAKKATKKKHQKIDKQLTKPTTKLL